MAKKTSIEQRKEELAQARLKEMLNLRKIRARKQLAAFILYTFPKYEINWHQLLTCRIIDKFVSGELKRLMISAPPRHGKSEIISRRFPAYLFGLFPEDEIMLASYSGDLAARMNNDCQDIMDQPEYFDLFPNTRLSPDGPPDPYDPRPRVKGKFKRSEGLFEIAIMNDKGQFKKGGSCRAAGVGGSLTGMGGEWIIIDDPIKNKEEAYSSTIREKAWGWYTTTIRTRLGRKDRLVLLQTRWHADDLAGRILEKMRTSHLADQFTVLNFEGLSDTGVICKNIHGDIIYKQDDGVDLSYLAEKGLIKEAEKDEGEEAVPGALQIVDPRRKGEALWPWRFTQEQHWATRENDPVDYASLYQGNPIKIEGNLFKRKALRYYHVDPDTGNFLCWRNEVEEPIIVEHRKLIRHVKMDPSLEMKTSNDPTGLAAWGYDRKNKIWVLLDVLIARIEYDDQLRQALLFAYRNLCTQIDVENEKLGKVLSKQSAGNDMVGGIHIPVMEQKIGKMDKFSRASIMANYIKNERVFFPENKPVWMPEYLKQLLGFPTEKHDEAVDITSMAADMQQEKSVMQSLDNNIWRKGINNFRRFRQ